MRRKSKFIMILFVCMVAMLAGCGQSKKEPDDYATNNVKSEKTDSAKKTSEGIAKDKIKVGVVHLSDKTTPRLIQFHTFKNAANPPFLGGFSIFSIVAA